MKDPLRLYLAEVPLRVENTRDILFDLIFTIIFIYFLSIRLISGLLRANGITFKITIPFFLTVFCTYGTMLLPMAHRGFYYLFSF